MPVINRFNQNLPLPDVHCSILLIIMCQTLVKPEDADYTNTGTMVSTFVIICLAVFAETVAVPQIVLLGDAIAIDCNTNCSSSQVSWSFTRHDSKKKEVLDVSSHAYSNTSDAYRIVTSVYGQVTLVIDRVFPALAGSYECFAMDGYRFSTQVTVLDPTPTCEESATLEANASTIRCKFFYYGLAPVLEWHPILNQSWTASCSALKGTVNCTFKNACTEENPPLNAVRRNRPPILEKYCGDNSTCKWGDASSRVGILHVKGYNITIEVWQCNHPGFTTTSAIQTSTRKNGDLISLVILAPVCVGVTLTVLILILVFLHKKYGRPICRIERKVLDVHIKTTTDEPVYSQVPKKKKEAPVQIQMRSVVDGIENAFREHSVDEPNHVVFENSMYASNDTCTCVEAETAPPIPIKAFDYSEIGVQESINQLNPTAHELGIYAEIDRQESSNQLNPKEHFMAYAELDFEESNGQGNPTVSGDDFSAFIL